LNLPAVTQSGQNVATCAQFLDGSALWGQVVRADVILVSGGERASSIPIELINSGFGGSVPSDCDGGSAAANASDAGFNGILGIGLWAQDCGANCDPAYTSTIQGAGSGYPYFTCSGSSCTEALVSIANQVTNPVSAFPVNNTGVIFQLPSISFSGEPSIDGTIILGIGTNADNALPGSAHVYDADVYADIATVFNGVTYSDSSSNTSITGSFLDSGSNSYMFAPPSTVSCCSMDSNGNVLSSTVACSSSSSSGWICSMYDGSATNEGVAYSTGAPQGTGVATAVFPDIANADIGSSTNPATFDFGLPFFFGKNIYLGFQKMSGTSLVAQPYWAY
jgi:hypothetical protein